MRAENEDGKRVCFMADPVRCQAHVKDHERPTVPLFRTIGAFVVRAGDKETTQ